METLSSCARKAAAPSKGEYSRVARSEDSGFVAPRRKGAAVAPLEDVVSREREQLAEDEELRGGAERGGWRGPRPPSQ